MSRGISGLLLKQRKNYWIIFRELIWKNTFKIILSDLETILDFSNILEMNLYKDAFGVVWDRTVDKDIGIVRGTVLSEPTLKGYQFPDPLDKRFYEDIPGQINKYGDRFRLYAIGFSLFERAWTMRGMENLFIDFYMNPGFRS